MSEFENFLLCERKRQANFKDFKRFGAFESNKKTLYSTRSCED
jgi:hypothetical protein